MGRRRKIGKEDLVFGPFSYLCSSTVLQKKLLHGIEKQDCKKYIVLAGTRGGTIVAYVLLGVFVFGREHLEGP